MFESIASADGSQARVVSSEGGFGDGRQRLLCLFPVNARNEVMASLALRARLANTFDGPSTPDNQDRRGFARRLYMLCKCAVKAIFLGRHLTAADIKGAQWAKSKGTCRQVIDFVAGHGLWATTSQVQHREDYHAKVVEDKDILPKGAQCAEIASDNSDHDPRVGERQGEGPHISFIAATAVTVGDDVGRMQDAASLRRRRSLTVDQITKGLDQEQGDRRPWTCVESELRKRGSTRRYTDNKAAIDRILEMWRYTSAGEEGAPCIIAGDEETYRFLYHIMKQNPEEYRQALLRRYWGAGVEHVAEELGTDNKKSMDGNNYRRAHNHLSAMWEAFWAVCQEKYAEHLAEQGLAPPEDPDDFANRVVGWIEARAEVHKAFALWKQFLLDDYPAYIAFRTALRTDHLAEMAILPESDRKVIAELFSVALGPDVFARIGLDERQEVANRFYKTMTKRIVSSFIEKLAPIAQLREEALIQFEREYIEQAQTARDRSREVASKRGPAVKKAREVLLKSPAFQGDEGVGKIMSLDGRVVTQKEEEELVSAPTKAVEKFQEVVAHCVLRDPKKKGTTKKNVFSIPPKNTTNQSTKSQGRKSGLKDNIANAFAGGREFKALFLNTMDAADEHGSVTPELLAELVSQVGAPRPYSMLNSKGGAKHANKAQGPNRCEAIKLGGGNGGGDPLLRTRVALMDTDLLVVCYDRGELVPVIKGQEQLARTEQVGGCTRDFDPSSTESVPSSQFQPWLRANSNEARDGIAANLAMNVLADEKWDGDQKPTGTAAFDGVGREVGLRDVRQYNEMSEAFGADGEADEGGWYGSGPEHLLHFRNRSTSGTVVQRKRGPHVGEAELPVAHFIVWAETYWGKKLDKWLVTSVDTDLWIIILLAMSTGKIPPNGIDKVDITVQRIVGGAAKFLWVNRVYNKIADLKDGSESAWPAADFQGWIPTADEKVRLFVLTYLLAGSDFLPAISGLPFYKMWILALKSVRAGGVFNRSLFVMEDGVWTVDIEQSIKLLATIFYFRYEAAFAGIATTPGDLLRNVNDSVRNYVDLIRVAIVKLGKKRTADTCPTYRSMREQCMRMKSVDG
ncbi:unnamed protein product [Ectocarpus sp. CCAP 1310/34]|nr:unnamed protein product [Ectocarpus sp. CCAP 1310/34]